MDIPPSIPQDIKVHLHQADTGTFDWLRECAEHNLKKSASKRVLKKSGKGKAAQMDANPAASHIEYFNSSRRIRLAASVPAIAALLKAGQIKDSMFLANEILNQGWYDPNTQNSPYEQHLAAFSKNNPKFRAIERHILPFLGTDVWPIKDEDRAEFPKPVRPKIIFMSSYPAIALITQLVSQAMVDVKGDVEVDVSLRFIVAEEERLQGSACSRGIERSSTAGKRFPRSNSD